MSRAARELPSSTFSAPISTRLPCPPRPVVWPWDSDGAVYAGLRDHIEVFDRKGQRTATWETPGKKVWFTGLAVSDQEVFAADAANRVVLRYDKSGKLAGRSARKTKTATFPA